MMHKQLVLLLFVVSSFLEAMEQPNIFSTKDEDEIYNEYKTVLPPKKEEYFHGKSIEELNTIFQCAPDNAQEIVDHLKDPKALTEPEYRAAFFVGKPGVGKTATALAIAYKLQKFGWKCDFMPCVEVLRSFRNKAAEDLLRELYAIKKAIKTKGDKVIFIADELQLLVRKSNDSHYDNDATAGAIQGFLDGIEGEHNFFFIGTMNNDTEMPTTLKNRIELDRIVFDPLTDSVVKRNIFRNKMVTPQMQLHQECDDAFIDAIINKLGDCPPRSYKNMRKELSRLLYHEAKLRNSSLPISNKLLPPFYQTTPDQIRYITKQHLTNVTNALLAARKDMKIDEKEETDAQRQERHFVQQQLIQLARVMHEKTEYEYDTSVNGNVSVGIGSIGGGIGINQQLIRTSQKITELGLANIFKIFNQEQLKVVEEANERLLSNEDASHNH